MDNLCECGCGTKTGLATRDDRRTGAVKGKPVRFIKGHHNRLKCYAPDGRRICSVCKVAKPATLEHFLPRPKNKADGLHSACRVCHEAKSKDWAKRNPDKVRARGRRHKQRNRQERPEYYAAIRKAYEARLRGELLAAYGGKCECCGITEPRFLTLEHKNRDGGEHRRRLKTGGGGVWRDLKRQGWPKDGYTLLCWNCNLATARGEPCPHKRDRSALTLNL